MSQREWFAIALRILGAMKLIEAFDNCIAAYDMSAGLFKPQTTTIGSAINHAIGMGVLGLILLFAAPFLSGLVIGISRKPDANSSDNA